MLYAKPALEPTYLVEVADGNSVEQVFASDSFRECLAVFETAVGRVGCGRVTLSFGIHVLLAAEPR